MCFIFSHIDTGAAAQHAHGGELVIVAGFPQMAAPGHNDDWRGVV